jgi:hypothetical protein
MSIIRQIFFLEIKKILKNGPANSVALFNNYRKYDSITKFKFNEFIRELITEQKIFFDDTTRLYSLKPLSSNELFKIPKIFNEIEKLIEEHQNLFKLSGDERLKHKDTILSLASRIEKGVESCCQSFLSYNVSERNIIRDIASPRLKRNLNKCVLDNPVNKIDTVISESDTEEQLVFGDLDDCIEPFDENSEEILYPILYKGFPSLTTINGNIDQIIETLNETFGSIGDSPAEPILEELKLVYKQELNTLKHDAFLYSLIYQLKEINNQEIEDSNQITRLKSYLEDPFKHFFALSETNIENISFIDDNPDFDHIVREVCRDNVITPNERKYLEEKAAEFFVNKDKIKKYLDNPFLGYETFKIFIDQICEDGIITDSERDYINEKAEQYNVPKDVMNKMISEGLFRAKFTSQLAQDEDFYEIVLIYLFSNVFKIKSVEEKLSTMISFLRNDQTTTDKLEIKRDVLYEAMRDEIGNNSALMSLKYFIDQVDNIYEVISILNIKAQTHEVNEQAEAKLDTKSQNHTEIFSLDGYTIEVVEVNQDMAPLFWSKTNGLNQCIYLNKLHPKYKLYSGPEFNQILIALGRSSLSFSDNSGDIFLNRLKNYLELIN